MEKAFRVLLSVLLVVSSASYGQENSQFWNNKFSQKLSEYFYSPIGNELLIPVKLMGNVEKPGLYHVPTNTSLTTLLTLTGGFRGKADLERIRVNRTKGKEVEVVEADFEDLLSTGKDITLSERDIIFVPEKKFFFGEDTIRTATVLSSILGIVIAGLLIDEKLNK